MDVTDTWFVGHGPSSAQKAKTKEGRFERKVNIVMLCNEHGYPIRWQVIPGRNHDSKAMIKMFKAIKGLDWLGHTPVVCDRAMGCTAHIRTLLKTNVHFLTALTKNEFGSYVKMFPNAPLLDYRPVSEGAFTEKDMVPVSKLAEKAGLTKVSKNLYIKDLGVVTYDSENQHYNDGEGADTPHDGAPVHKTVEAMRYCLKLRSDKEEGRASNNRIAGITYGLDKSKVARFLRLARLPQDVQEAILEGQAIGLSINDLVRAAALEEDAQQRAEFERLKKEVAQKPDSRRNRGASKATTTTTPPQEQTKPFKVRAVLYFNPEIFIQKRITARKTLAQINSFIQELNKNTASPASRKTAAGIERAVKDKLRAYHVAEAFDVLITKIKIDGMMRYQTRVILKDAEWKSRRQYDGFSIIVGHPEIEGSGEDLCQLYRSKDTIETDFRVIKSFIKLRPIGHRNDHKVCAHVTICMLALLMERTLRKRLEAVRFRFSSAKALDVLKTCNLNMYEGIHNNPVAYTITKPNEDQQAVLRTLRLKHLSDDMEAIGRIVPR